MNIDTLIREIRGMTALNLHGEAYQFAAHQLGIDGLALKFARINKQHEKLGFLPYDLYYERHEAYQELMRKARFRIRHESDYQRFHSAF